jgi:hypothetical protein
VLSKDALPWRIAEEAQPTNPLRGYLSAHAAGRGERGTEKDEFPPPCMSRKEHADG